MEADDTYRCPFCSFNGTTKRGLSQHIRKKAKCNEKRFASLQLNDKGYKAAREYLGITEVVGYKRQRYDNTESTAFVGIGTNSTTTSPHDSDLESDDDFPANDHQQDNEDANVSNADDTIVNGYADFVNESSYRLPFNNNERTAIDLMVLLRGKKTPLNMYESVTEWHFRSAGFLRPHEPVSSLPQYLSRERVFNRLYERYGLANMVSIPKEILLPSSHAKVTIITNNAYWCIQSLLSDPSSNANLHSRLPVISNPTSTFFQRNWS